MLSWQYSHSEPLKVQSPPLYTRPDAMLARGLVSHISWRVLQKTAIILQTSTGPRLFPHQAGSVIQILFIEHTEQFWPEKRQMTVHVSRLSASTCRMTKWKEQIISSNNLQRILWHFFRFRTLSQFNERMTLPVEKFRPGYHSANPSLADTIWKYNPHTDIMLHDKLDTWLANLSDRYETINFIECIEYFTIFYLCWFMQAGEDFEYNFSNNSNLIYWSP